VSANLYIKGFDKRLMEPYVIIEKAGFDVLFTGIITEKIVDAMKLDEVIGGSWTCTRQLARWAASATPTAMMTSTSRSC
jgi:2',3'-cyclic-nucleotide 2'-phosphodiesterase (5'-nucleotidase family)